MVENGVDRYGHQKDVLNSIYVCTFISGTVVPHLMMYLHRARCSNSSFPMYVNFFMVQLHL